MVSLFFIPSLCAKCKSLSDFLLGPQEELANAKLKVQKAVQVAQAASTLQSTGADHETISTTIADANTVAEDLEKQIAARKVGISSVPAV